ncbi:MAG: glycosyltransferase, partial [Cetobacterium sp.]
MGLSKEIENIKSDKKYAWIHASIENWYEKPGRIKRLGMRLKKYDKIVTICEDMKKETKNLYPFLKEKLITIYNPFNFERIIGLSEEKIEENMKYLLDEKYIVSVMRLTNHQKDFKTLIDGFKLAKENGIKEKLYILGDGPDKENIQELIDKCGMKEEVLLLGSQKNPYPWLKNAEFFVHSSKYEGFGLVLVEAMILGKAVISSDCPIGPKEVLENGESGVLYPVGNSKKLSRNILSLLMNIDLKEKYVIKGKKRAEDFNVARIIKEYENFIDFE